ncbi:methyltransferase domain-containing protein [Lysobacter arenosi]|uniref:Methyltransferase domain-containing protein n=1 Tax=Lysobacter arenosi TaxID=2795387 RepID=A0ABX7RAN7_9GAMM|nr:methyltransferase domain-containing protein [Lysobacter arenosi]QSX74461.1 methyltransferase domain-containing protein [Lysobacter arenosi]
MHKLLRNSYTRRLRRLVTGARLRAFPSKAPTAQAPACNICGHRLVVPLEVFSDREARSCVVCGSTLRFRAIMAALQSSLDGDHQVRVLERLPRCKHLKGIGMSDTGSYAGTLKSRFDYTNTFFHTEPLLDIRSPARHLIGQFDFVVSSDVLEHVDGPPQRAFSNLRALLKPGGILVFTVPYGAEQETVEHYPELHDYRIEGEGDMRVLINVTTDGREQRFTDLCFHGGDGSTLELRRFAYPHLIRLLEAAGFKDIRVHDVDHPEWGIVHQAKEGLPITATAA